MNERPTGHTEAQRGRSAAGEVESAARETAGKAKEQLKQDAESLAEAGKSRLEGEAEGKRHLAAREARALSRALQSAAAEAESHNSLLTAPIRQLASTCDDLAHRLEGTDTRQMFAELEDLGRRQPAAFFGAAVAAGFLGTRFLRAGAEQEAGMHAARGTSSTTGPAGGGSQHKAEGQQP